MEMMMINMADDPRVGSTVGWLTPPRMMRPEALEHYLDLATGHGS